MKRRFLIFSALALVVAACADPSPTTTTSQLSEAPTPEPVLLSYSLEPGTVLTFEVSLDQSIEISARGDTSALEAEGIPGDASLRLTGTALVGHEVAAGPEEGTFEVTLRGDFSELEISGTVGGEPFEHGDLPMLTQPESFESTFLVDEKGRPVNDHGFGALFGDFDDFSGFSDLFAAGSDLDGFFGPPLTEREVTVGDSWTESFEIPGEVAGLDEDLVIESSTTVTGSDTIGGTDVLVLETLTTTPDISIDMADLMRGMFHFFLRFAPADERAGVEEMLDQIRFLFEMPASRTDTTTWFDPEAGVIRQAELTGDGGVVLDINMPDEETGELVAFNMEVNVEQSVSFRLVSSSDA